MSLKLLSDKNKAYKYTMSKILEKRPKKFIMYSFKKTLRRNVYNKEMLLRHFRNQELDNDLPIFVPILVRLVGTSHPDYENVNAKLCHEAFIGKILTEFKNCNEQHCALITQIKNEIDTFNEVRIKKKISLDIYILICEYLF